MRKFNLDKWLQETIVIGKPKKKKIKKLKKSEIDILEKQKLKEMDEEFEKIKKHIEERKAYEGGIRKELEEVKKQLETETDPLTIEHLLFKQGSLIQKLVN